MLDFELIAPIKNNRIEETTEEGVETFGKRVRERLNCLKKFAENELRTNPARADEDFWAAFDDDMDVQFSVCDDGESENFDRVEIWVYAINESAEGKGKTIDLSTGILIGLYDRSARG